MNKTTVVEPTTHTDDYQFLPPSKLRLVDVPTILFQSVRKSDLPLCTKRAGAGTPYAGPPALAAIYALGPIWLGHLLYCLKD
jgi:hypothetical protein